MKRLIVAAFLLIATSLFGQPTILEIERGQTVTFEWEAVTTLSDGRATSDRIFYQIYAAPIMGGVPQWGSPGEVKLLPDKYFYDSGSQVSTEVVVSLPEDNYKIVVTAYRFGPSGDMLESGPSSEQIFFNMTETNLPPAKPVTVKVRIN